MTSSCKGCKYFTPIETNPPQAGVGICRRYPPKWTTDSHGWDFPGMKEIGWCGEYTQKVTLQ